MTRTVTSESVSLCLNGRAVDYKTYNELPKASIPGMFERSITIGSSGKTFSVTGWKCGWALTGNKDIMNAIRKAHSINIYVIATPIQEAVARAFEIELDKLEKGQQKKLYWTKLSDMVLKKRNSTIKMLTSVGLEPIAPEGGYFMVADCRQLIKRLDLSDFPDKRGPSFSFVQWLSKNGVQGLPLSIFFCPKYQHLGEGLIRFCFIKSEATLNAAERVLTQLKERLGIEN